MNSKRFSSAGSAAVDFGHRGRVVLVTGGAQGIGAACVRRFAREGAQVIVSDVADERGLALATELGAHYLHCDVGSKADVDAAVDATVRVRDSYRMGSALTK
ncbi:MAG: SDR family NAD(P)-dependent oxidoreductase [Burkholderiaceae bacterium]